MAFVAAWSGKSASAASVPQTILRRMVLFEIAFPGPAVLVRRIMGKSAPQGDEFTLCGAAGKMVNMKQGQIMTHAGGQPIAAKPVAIGYIGVQVLTMPAGEQNDDLERIVAVAFGF